MNRKEKIHSLNRELPKFFFEELEERLETDPLTLGGLLNLEEGAPDLDCNGHFTCSCMGYNNACHDLSYCDRD